MTTTTRSIIHFIWRTILMAVAVVLPFGIWYICSDPFKVIYHYDEYYENPATHPNRIGLNKGVVTVNTYLNNIHKGKSYNAFIFGSSISCYYNAYEWRELLRSRDSVGTVILPFHFDSSSETPMSMSRKVEFLYHSGAPIDYALIVLDPIILGTEENDSPYAIDPVEFYNTLPHLIKYHYTFFRAATNADFFKNLLAVKFTGASDNIGHNPVFERQPIIHDQLVNEENLPQWDSIIAVNPAEFYNLSPLLPPSPTVTPGQPVITEERRKAFAKIAEIFTNKKTDYQIIISPNRRGISLSDDDLQILQEIFEPTRIHDFSLTYADDLRTDTLLYDNTHYRPVFASKMMTAVYGSKQ